MAVCKKCGHELKPGKKFCTNCGTEINPQASQVVEPTVKAPTSKAVEPTVNASLSSNIRKPTSAVEQYAVQQQQAAERGSAYAQYDLGVCYEEGKGVAQDNEKAFYWYTKAAEQEYDKAQYKLGYCYDFGINMPKDYKKAMYWYEKAAARGNIYAKKQQSFHWLDKGLCMFCGGKLDILTKRCKSCDKKPQDEEIVGIRNWRLQNQPVRQARDSRKK